MLQRIQTLYLLIAAGLLALLQFFSLWSASCVVDNKPVLEQYEFIVNQHFTLYIPFLIILTLILISIFLFKNRKMQIRIISLTLLILLAFISLAMYEINMFYESLVNISSHSYQLTFILPIASFVLLVLAILAIKKDDELVKSLDRLR